MIEGDELSIDSLVLIVDGNETMMFEEVKEYYSLMIPDSIENDREKIDFTFNRIVQLIDDDMKRIEQTRKEIINEIDLFFIDDSQTSHSQWIRYVRNQIQIEYHQRILNDIEKVKTISNKFPMNSEEDNTQSIVLQDKFDHFSKQFSKNYQIDLPPLTDIDGIRSVLNNARELSTKELKTLQIDRDELLRKLDKIKKKEQVKQREQTDSISEVK